MITEKLNVEKYAMTIPVFFLNMLAWPINPLFLVVTVFYKKKQ
jgi:hypothetical protein